MMEILKEDLKCQKLFQFIFSDMNFKIRLSDLIYHKPYRLWISANLLGFKSVQNYGAYYGTNERWLIFFNILPSALAILSQLKC